MYDILPVVFKCILISIFKYKEGTQNLTTIFEKYLGTETHALQCILSHWNHWSCLKNIAA